jgi:hypothetical protein
MYIRYSHKILILSVFDTVQECIYNIYKAFFAVNGLLRQNNKLLLDLPSTALLGFASCRKSRTNFITLNNRAYGLCPSSEILKG